MQSFDVSVIDDNSFMTITSISSVRAAVSESNVVLESLPERQNIVATLPLPEQLAPYISDLDWSVENRSAIQTLGSDLADSGGDNLFGQFQGAISGIVQRIGIEGPDILTGSRSIAQNQFGIAVDPLKEIFFNGVNNRTYPFTWKFSPKNSNEAQNILDMISSLETAAHPDKLDMGIFRIPDHFNITFDEGLHIPEITTVVCTNISVDYSVNGAPKFFKDGKPAFIQLSMNFTELEVRTSSDLTSGAES